MSCSCCPTNASNQHSSPSFCRRHRHHCDPYLRGNCCNRFHTMSSPLQVSYTMPQPHHLHSHPPPHTHYTNGLDEVHFSPHGQSPHPHFCHSRRELIPSSVSPHHTSPQCSRLHPQTLPTNHQIIPSVNYPEGIQLEFSPMSSPIPVAQNFEIAYNIENVSPLAKHAKMESKSPHVTTPTRNKRKGVPTKRTPRQKNKLVQVDDEVPKSPAFKHPSPKKTSARKSSSPLKQAPAIRGSSRRVAIKQSPVSEEDDDIPNPSVDVSSVRSSPSPPASSDEDSESVEVEVESLPQEKPKKVTVLLEWMFDILVPDHVVLLGYKKEDVEEIEEPDLWRTGRVVERISTRELRTENGTTYHLKGNIQGRLMGPKCEYARCLSKATVWKFIRGFPPTWKSLIADSSGVSTPSVSLKEEKKPSPFTPEPGPSQSTTSSNSGFLSSLKRSSRGRTVKPSLFSLSPYIQNTTNIYSYDAYGNFQGLASPIIDLTLSDVEDITPTQRKQRRKKQSVKKEDDEEVFPLKNTKTSRSDVDSTASESKASSSDKATKRKRSKSVTMKKAKKTPRSSLASEQSISDTSDDQSPLTEVDQEIVPTRSSRPSPRRAKAKGLIKTGAQISVKEEKEDVPDPLLMSDVDSTASENKSSSDKATQRKRPKSVTMKKAKKPSNKTPRSSLASEQSVSDTSDDQSPLTEVDQEIVPTRSSKSSPRRAKAKALDVIEKSSTSKDSPTSSLKTAATPRSYKKNKKNCVALPRQTKKHHLPESPLLKTHSVMPPPKITKSPVLCLAKAKPRAANSVGPGSDNEGFGEESEWTPQKVRLLNSIVLNMPALDPHFWETVARRFPGHTARDCSQKYMEFRNKTTKRPSKQSQAKPAKATEPTKRAITGKVGTIKRKRELRAIMEDMDKGYADDIFDSTPFKKKVKTRVRVPDWSDSDSEESSSSEEDGEEILSDTPNVARRRVGAPRVHTPKLSDFITTPDLKSKLKRNAADNVMYQIEKTKKHKTKLLSVPASRKATGQAKPRFSKQKLSSIRSGERRVQKMFEDTEEEESDEDEDYSDIELLLAH